MLVMWPRLLDVCGIAVVGWAWGVCACAAFCWFACDEPDVLGLVHW